MRIEHKKSHKKTWILTILAIAVLVFLFYPRNSAVKGDPAKPGGDFTVNDAGIEAFSRPGPTVPLDKLRIFTFGNKIFNTNWVIAPASVTSLDGLGPVFNRNSCSGCHFKDGRGRPPLSPDEPMNSMLLRLSVQGKNEVGGPMPHPAYGSQLNDKAIPGVPPEGRATIFYTEIPGEFADGGKYTLRKPEYVFNDLAFGELGSDIMFSPRVAPPLPGMGLLEAIPEETIISFADSADKNRDGVKGRPNYVWDMLLQKNAVGRFGWKANEPTLRQQAAAAINGDIGVTSMMFPKENCTEIQEACKLAPHGGNPELSKEQLDKLEFYLQTLAVPARRNIDDPAIKKGEELFQEAGCASCHRSNIKTGTHSKVPQLSNQVISPFTDLLLHDMGQGLADNRPDFEASGSEWRTTPLWGIGLVNTVNQHTNFLHDGRARNFEEAILWHGGEGEKAKENFRKMPKSDREKVIKFLESL